MVRLKTFEMADLKLFYVVYIKCILLLGNVDSYMCILLVHHRHIIWFSFLMDYNYVVVVVEVVVVVVVVWVTGGGNSAVMALRLNYSLLNKSTI